MTEQEAHRRVTEIFDKVATRSHVPPSNARIVFRGGELRAEAHPALSTHFRPAWYPEADDLRPLDLERFTVKAAAAQIERYGRAGYVPVRRKLEAFLDALLGDGAVAHESHVVPDSFVVGGGALSIAETSRRAHEPEYGIEFGTNTVVQELAPGEAPADSRTIDVTDMPVDDLRRLVNPDVIVRPAGGAR